MDEDQCVPNPDTRRTSKRLVWMLLLILVFFILSGMALRSFIVSSDDYARATIPKLMKSWDLATLRQELNSDMFSDADVARISEVGKRRLGQLQTFTLHRATFSPATVGGRKVMRMCYAVPGKFEKAGYGSFSFCAANIEGRWQVIDFDVSDDQSGGNNIFRPVPASAFSKPPTYKP